MGKKPDKGRDKAGTDSKADDDPWKTPEPYHCTGNFEVDYTELCRRAGMTEIPPIVTRSKAPGPAPHVVAQDTKPGKKGKQQLQQQQQQEADLNASLLGGTLGAGGFDEVDGGGAAGTSGGEGGASAVDTFIPTTYVLKSNYDYMRPVVQIDADLSDKKATIKQIYIRNWKIDDTMMNILKQVVPMVEKLHLLTLYNVGLTDSSLETLGKLVQECANLKTLNVEGSPTESEEWHRLIMGENNKVWNLSLRNNRISNIGARFIGHALGTARNQNQTLVKLNLAFNHITSQGAKELAAGLRMNRCLLVLDMANNKIGDEGAKQLAHVMSRFRLTHEEIVERRVRMRDQLSPERHGKSPPSSRKADRPGSKGTAADKKGAAGGGKGGASVAGGGAGGKGAKGGKEGGDKDKKDDKKSSSKGSAQDTAAQAATKGKKVANVPAAQGDPKAAAGAGKQQRGGKATPKGPRGTSQGDTENSDTYEQKHPLDEETIYEDGDLWIKIGNRSLISLNLNRNKISEKGAYELLKAMQYQSRMHNQGPKNAPIGLMRLTLAGNEVSPSSETYQKILQICADKDPLKPPASAGNNSGRPEDDSQSLLGSTTGRHK